MRQVTLCVVLVALVMLVIPATNAADWNYGFRLGSGPWSQFGVMSSASDGLDNYDQGFGDAWVPEATIVAVGSKLGSNFLQEDYRSPILPGQMKKWQVNVEYLHVGIWPPPTSVTVNWMPQTAIPSGLTMSLKLLNPPANYVGPTLWNLNVQPAGSVTLPWSGSVPPFPFPYPSYNFEYTVTAAVPEPSGILTVLSGLIGTLTALRRRR